MKHLRLFVSVLAVLAAIVAVVLLIHQRQALESLRAENAALRQELDPLRDATAEADRLRKQNTALSARATDPMDLARLRADSAELRRQRAEAARTSATPAARVAAPAPTGLPESPAPVPRAFTAKGTAQLKTGESLVTGGWKMDDGKRGYALVTPVLTKQEDGQVAVLMESRLFSLPGDALAAAGLQQIISDGRDADRYGVTDGKMTEDLLKRLQELSGVDVLSSPKILTLPGREASIQIGGTAGGGEGIQLRLQPNLPADGQGFHLDFDLGLSQPAVTNR